MKEFCCLTDLEKELFDESDFTYIYFGTVKKIRMVSFANAVKQLMLLPGSLAQANRSKFA